MFLAQMTQYTILLPHIDLADRAVLLNLRLADAEFLFKLLGEVYGRIVPVKFRLVGAARPWQIQAYMAAIIKGFASHLLNRADPILLIHNVLGVE